MLRAICSRKELEKTGYYPLVSDIIDCGQLGELKNITHHISTTRFQHCLNVSYYSYLVCRKLHLNARSAARAGLLHDLFYYDRREYNSSRGKGQLSHSAMHAKLAAENAAGVTEITPLEREAYVAGDTASSEVQGELRHNGRGQVLCCAGILRTEAEKADIEN